jgi:hypothetical protein
MTGSEVRDRGRSATRNSPSGLALTWGDGWSCQCGQSGKSRERHCIGCHATDDHNSCWWCGQCLPKPRRYSGASYCSSSCRVYVSRWDRSAAGAQWRRERDERQRAREKERERTEQPRVRDWFEDPFHSLLGGFLGGFGAYPEPPDSLALRVLGLSTKPISQDAVKSAFRTSLMRFHPDLATYTEPSVRAVWERVLGADPTVQELVWARDVLYRKIPPPAQPGGVRIDIPKPPTEEERRERLRWERESRRTGSLCSSCGHVFEPEEIRSLRRMPGLQLDCAACVPGRYAHLSQPKPCEVCARPLRMGGRIWRRHWVCSDYCSGVAYGRDRRLGRYQEPVDCPICHERIDDRRGDARYCSSACRQKAYRARRVDVSG